MLKRIRVSTRSRVELRDITDQVQEAVAASNVRNGECLVFVPHTTAGITLNEHADPGVVKDIADRLEMLVPQHAGYHHTEGNAPAHVKTSLTGSSQTIFVEDGRLVLGMWQGIFLCEFDGPREREVVVKVFADRG